jgi:hypothetical protein
VLLLTFCLGAGKRSTTTCCGLAVIFLGSKYSDQNPIVDHRVSYREIGVKLLAGESIEPLGERAVSFKNFSTNRQ